MESGRQKDTKRKRGKKRASFKLTSRDSEIKKIVKRKRNGERERERERGRE